MNELEAHTHYLWSVCYRMTASASDADDLVQETFLRALEQPPLDTSRPWRPWLTRVALNLAIDALRRRKRAPYDGPWLPEPFVSKEAPADPPSEAPPPDERISMLESATYAFLIAAEALSEDQRAVLLLRDVCELSGEETAALLELSLDNVKQILHRARATLAPYYAHRTFPSAALAERNQRALAAFLAAVDRKDVEATIDTLTDDAVSVSDGGGRVKAALTPVQGARGVARLHIGLAEEYAAPLGVQTAWLNGLPALVVEFAPRGRGYATRFIVRCDSDGDGRVRALHTIMNPMKLVRLRLP
ncbi:MAG: sigma-70 family RNA polymerase sigma factor [Deltaproteobacteria bacterium]|nr:sigma-70 family RNA polymerase sigma factor [Deltaproteobacteria bacterium]